MKKKKKCDCGFCEYGKRVEAAMKRQKLAKDRNLIRDMMNDLVCAQSDSEYWRMKYHGLWPE